MHYQNCIALKTLMCGQGLNLWKFKESGLFELKSVMRQMELFFFLQITASFAHVWS